MRLVAVSFPQGICMIIGGLRHSEQTFNSRSTGVSSALLFISVGGKYLKTNPYVMYSITQLNIFGSVPQAVITKEATELFKRQKYETMFFFLAVVF